MDLSEPDALEIPEIGPFLGTLADIRERWAESACPALDTIRLGLVARVFDHVAQARAAAGRGDRAGARGALATEAWLAMWHDAVAAADEALARSEMESLARASAKSRFPARRLAAMKEPGRVEADRAALEACGIPLEERIERGMRSSESWWEFVRGLAVALEDSWERLEVTARDYLARTTEAARLVESWRPARWPWISAIVLAVALGMWVGLALGGIVSRPKWLDPLANWFWSFPWPS